MIKEKTQVDEIIKEGEQAFLNQDYDASIELLNKSLELDPENLESHYFLGIVYTRKQEYKKAIKYFSFILESEYGFIYVNHVKNMMGYIYAVEGELTKAREYLEDVLRFEIENIKALSTMAYLYYKDKQYETAIKLYEKVLEIDPENTNALNSLGYIYIENEQDIDKGIDLCKKALEKKPENPAYLDSIGWGYFVKGNEDEAVDYLRQAFELAPENAEIKNHLREILKI